MTCDDNDNLNPEETQEKRDLKRKLNVGAFSSNQDNKNVNANKVFKAANPEEHIKLSNSPTNTPNPASLVDPNPKNTNTVDDKGNVRTNYSTKKRKRLEIETEFKILQSLIPNIANKQSINELEIIDACVNYIEALQEQLNIRNPEDHNCNTTHNDPIMPTTTSITSLISKIADEKIDGNNRRYYQIEENDDYLTSESSSEDCSDDELEEDKNNNKESLDKEKNFVDGICINGIETSTDTNIQLKSHASDKNNSM